MPKLSVRFNTIAEVTPDVDKYGKPCDRITCPVINDVVWTVLKRYDASRLKCRTTGKTLAVCDSYMHNFETGERTVHVPLHARARLMRAGVDFTVVN